MQTKLALFELVLFNKNMSVRVLTERLVLEGKERAVFRMLKSMRKVAIDARGFVQSTAFRCEHEPQRIVVLSEWHDTR